MPLDPEQNLDQHLLRIIETLVISNPFVCFPMGFNLITNSFDTDLNIFSEILRLNLTSNYEKNFRSDFIALPFIANFQLNLAFW